MVVAFYFRLHLAYFPRPVVAIFARPEQSGFGTGQGVGIFHYATDKIERGGRPFPAARRKFF